MSTKTRDEKYLQLRKALHAAAQAFVTHLGREEEMNLLAASGALTSYIYSDESLRPGGKTE